MEGIPIDFIYTGNLLISIHCIYLHMQIQVNQ